jgi:hypothetical protein
VIEVNRNEKNAVVFLFFFLHTEFKSGLSYINQAVPLTYDHVIGEDAPLFIAHPCHRMCGGINRQDLNSSSILYELVQNINYLCLAGSKQHRSADGRCCAPGETPLLNWLPPELKMPFYLLLWMHRTGGKN